MTVGIGKLVLVLIASVTAYAIVWHRFGGAGTGGIFSGTGGIFSALAAVVGAAVGVGGFRICFLAGGTSGWLIPPAFILVVFAGTLAGACVGHGVSAPIPARYEDAPVGLMLFSAFWAAYAGVGTVAGCVLTFLLSVIRGAALE